MEKTTFAARLKHFRESYLNIGVREIARQCDLSPGNISSWETGGSLPSIPLIKKIYATYPRLSPMWLEEGKGEMLKPIADQSGEAVLNPDYNKPNLSREEEQALTIERQEKMIEWLQIRLEKAEESLARAETKLERVSIEREKLMAFVIDEGLVKKFLANHDSHLRIVHEEYSSATG